MYRIIIADDEEIECRALEMMIRNEFPDMEILPYGCQCEKKSSGYRDH